MAKKLYIGVDGVAQEAKEIYVGINGVAKEVVKGYVGDENNVPRLFWEKNDTTIEGKWNSLSSKADELVLQHTMFVYLGLSWKFSSDETKRPYTQYLYKLNNEPMYYALACIDCPPNYSYYIIVLITLSQYENGGICYYFTEKNNQGQALLSGDNDVQTINYNNETWYLRYTTVSFSKSEINSGVNSGYFTYGIEYNKYYPECMLNSFSDAYPIGNEYNDTTLNNAILSLSNSLLNRIHLNKIVAPPEIILNYPSPLKVYKTNSITYSINGIRDNGQMVNYERIFNFNSDIYCVFFYVTYIENYGPNNEYSRRRAKARAIFISDSPIIGTVQTTKYNNADGSIIQTFSPSSINTTDDSPNYVLGKLYHNEGYNNDSSYYDTNADIYLTLEGVEYNPIPVEDNADTSHFYLAYIIYFLNDIVNLSN